MVQDQGSGVPHQLLIGTQDLNVVPGGLELFNEPSAGRLSMRWFVTALPQFRPKSQRGTVIECCSPLPKSRTL
jgi:hypothetical protein